MVNNSEVGQRWGTVSYAASSPHTRTVLIAKLGDRAKASLSKCELSPRPAAAELFPPFPGKTSERVQRLESLEEGPWGHTSESTQADLVPAGQEGWSWPRALFWKLSISLPEVPLPSRPPLLFSFLTSARGEIPTTGMGDTSSSLAGGSPATPAEGPAEPHSHRATHRAVGPTPSHQPSPETADRAENMASGTAAGALAAWRRCLYSPQPRHTWGGLAGRVRLPRSANPRPSGAQSCRKWALLHRPGPRNRYPEGQDRHGAAIWLVF